MQKQSCRTRRPIVRHALVTLALSTTAIFLVSAAGPNTAAACRGAGSVSSYPGGVKYTTWPDGAWLKEYPSGVMKWDIPKGGDPIPGVSPGHDPRPR